jgi:hypothetical protein
VRGDGSRDGSGSWQRLIREAFPHERTGARLQHLGARVPSWLTRRPSRKTPPSSWLRSIRQHFG